jgi:hypothetical protein
VSENGLEADRERFDPFVTERKSINSLERVKGIEPSFMSLPRRKPLITSRNRENV